jgi:hypothetical protein
MVLAQGPTGILGLRGQAKNHRRGASATNTAAPTLRNISENDYYLRESEFAERFRVG